MQRVVVPLAEGFEEIEAVCVIDVLRRAKVDVVLAAVQGDDVAGAHGITLGSDACLADLSPDDFDLLVLPGGEPGTTHLAADATVAAWLEHFIGAGKPIGAICAAPRILAAHKVLQQTAATSHPSVESLLRQAGALYQQDRVVRSGHIITSRGPGTALEFSLALLDVLGKGQEAQRLRASMLMQG